MDDFGIICPPTKNWVLEALHRVRSTASSMIWSLGWKWWELAPKMRVRNQINVYIYIWWYSDTYNDRLLDIFVQYHAITYCSPLVFCIEGVMSHPFCRSGYSCEPQSHWPFPLGFTCSLWGAFVCGLHHVRDCSSVFVWDDGSEYHQPADEVRLLKVTLAYESGVIYIGCRRVTPGIGGKSYIFEQEDIQKLFDSENRIQYISPSRRDFSKFGGCFERLLFFAQMKRCKWDPKA